MAAVMIRLGINFCAVEASSAIAIRFTVRVYDYCSPHLKHTGDMITCCAMFHNVP